MSLRLSFLTVHTFSAEGLAIAFLVCLLAGAPAGGGEKKPPPPSTPIPGAELRVNEWVAVEQGSGGARAFGGVAARGKVWPVYDCARNAWVAVEIGGRNPTSGNLGLIYDPKRRRALAVDNSSRVFALRLDMSKGKVLE